MGSVGLWAELRMASTIAVPSMSRSRGSSGSRSINRATGSPASPRYVQIVSDAFLARVGDAHQRPIRDDQGLRKPIVARFRPKEIAEIDDQTSHTVAGSVYQLCSSAMRMVPLCEVALSGESSRSTGKASEPLL
jgi:hypothetical protein